MKFAHFGLNCFRKWKRTCFAWVLRYKNEATAALACRQISACISTTRCRSAPPVTHFLRLVVCSDPVSPQLFSFIGGVPETASSNRTLRTFHILIVVGLVCHDLLLIRFFCIATSMHLVCFSAAPFFCPRRSACCELFISQVMLAVSCSEQGFFLPSLRVES